ncbi:hypothetical protein ACOWKU_01080 [Helicobacter pylori]
MRVLWWVLQKSGLDIDDKKAFEIESKATKPPLMAQVCLKQIDNHNIVKSLVQRLIAKRFYNPIRALIVFQTSKSFK